VIARINPSTKAGQLHIRDLHVAVTGDKSHARVTLTGVAPTTMEREYAAAILEGAGYHVDNQLTAARRCDQRHLAFVTSQIEKCLNAGDREKARRLADLYAKLLSDASSD